MNRRMLWLCLFSSLMSMSSCKSTNRSKLDSLYFSKGDQSYFVHYEDNNFFINSCASTPELQRALAIENDTDKAKDKCHDTVTAITPMALKDALAEELKGTASDDLIGTKIERVAQLESQMASFKASLAQAAAEMESSTLEAVKQAQAAEIAKTKADLANADKELANLKAALTDPAKLKQIDISSTLALQSQIASNADDQAAIFTAMLRDVKIYTLNSTRDSILIKILDRFNLTCTPGSETAVRKTSLVGIENVEYECQASGYPKVIATTCALDGYERIDNFCLFTGKNVALSSLVATNNGICGVSTASGIGVLTCWGKPGEFPMLSGTFTTPTSVISRNITSPISSKVLADKIAASGRQICTLKNTGSVLKCVSIPEIPGSTVLFSQIVGGDGHLCGITTDGNLQCWGESAYGQASIPSGLAKVKSVSTTENGSCAVDENNKLACWGEVWGLEANESSTPPSDIGTVEAVSTGTRHSCALTKDKGVRCWGSNDSGQTAVPNDVKNVRMIVAGRYETCLIKADNSLKCWGRDTSGRAYSTGPSLGNVQRIIPSRWGSNFCAIYGAENKVSCWGSLIYNSVYDITPPADLKQVKDLAITASGYACAILNGGAVKCWGNTADVPTTIPDAFTVKAN